MIVAGLGIPLYGITLALTASPEESDMQVIGFEILALTVGYMLFQGGRWMIAKSQET